MQMIDSDFTLNDWRLGGGGAIRYCRPIEGYISETVQDRR